MKRFLTLLCTVLFISSNAQEADSSLQNFSLSNDPLMLFDRGNQAYQAGEYDKSIAFYEDVIATGKESAALYFNLGNAHFKYGNNTQAILNYERALKLKPEDEDIRTNLEIANLQTIDKVEARPAMFLSVWWKDLLNTHTTDEWGKMSIYTIFIALAMMLAYLWLRGIAKKLFFFAGMMMIVVSLTCFFLGSRQNALQSSSEYAIVMSSSVTVKSSPDGDGTKLFVIHEGTKVQVLDEVNEWSEIALMNGNKGWVKTDVFQSI